MAANGGWLLAGLLVSSLSLACCLLAAAEVRAVRSRILPYAQPGLGGEGWLRSCIFIHLASFRTSQVK